MSKEVIETYTEYQVDRAQRLHHTAQAFRALYDTFNNPLLKDKPNKSFKILMPTEDGKMAQLEIDRHFNFGIWLCMKSLIDDLAKDGQYETAEDIIENTFGYERKV